MKEFAQELLAINKTADYDLTVIVPVYNEEENMKMLEEKLSAFTAIAKCPQDICSRHNDFFYISFLKNAGLSAAIKAGFDTAQSKYVGYIDADLQTAPDDFNLLLEYINDFKLVMGIRANRKDSGFKRLQSKIANTDTGCPLKILHTDYAKRIPFFTGMHRFLPALILLQDGGCFKEIPVRHFPRVAGKSKFNLWNRLISPFKDCFAYRWMKHRYINYHIKENNI